MKAVCLFKFLTDISCSKKDQHRGHLFQELRYLVPILLEKTFFKKLSNRIRCVTILVGLMVKYFSNGQLLTRMLVILACIQGKLTIKSVKFKFNYLT